MNVFKPNISISVETILSYISQEEIMSKYLGRGSAKGMFCSPLRTDKHPTCTLTWINGKLLFTDWAIGKPLDCFGVVMKKYGCNFYKALKIVANDFELARNIKLGNVEKKYTNITYTTEYKNSNKSKIEVKTQSFTQDNIDYLTSYYITSKIASKYNVFSPKYVWLNGRIVYKYHKSNPALAYYFGIDEDDNAKWKIYFYKNDYRRFLTNTNRINGWIQIPDRGDKLVITKSLKDVMCLDIFNIPAIAMQAETQTPYDYIIKEVQERFTNVVSLFDHDDAGIVRAKSINKLYNIPYYFIKDSEAKDFSDYIRLYGKQSAETLTKEFI